MMQKVTWFMSLLLLTSLVAATPALAQTASADSEAAAKELITVLKLPEQFRAMMPMMFQNLKPSIVQNRADVEKAFDAITPLLIETMGTRLNDLVDSAASIYAANFSAEELRAATAFYKTPAGQKFLAKTPLVMQQTMAAGQQWGRLAGIEAERQMVDELRKRNLDPAGTK